MPGWSRTQPIPLAKKKSMTKMKKEITQHEIRSTDPVLAESKRFPTTLFETALQLERRLSIPRRTMTTTSPELFQVQPVYNLPKLKWLPLREQPAYRVTQNAAGCNVSELLAAVIGGPRQIEIAEELLALFQGDLRRLYQAHPAELARVKGISQATAVRIKAAFNLGLR